MSVVLKSHAEFSSCLGETVTFSPSMCYFSHLHSNFGLQNSPARAVICPHAGYRYSGPTAAHSFRQIDPRFV